MDFLDMLILLKLKDGVLSDYDVISHIQRRFSVPVSPGAVYSCLYHLKEDGLVRQVQSQKKKTYGLTRVGEEKTETLLNMRDKLLGLVVDLFV